MSKISRIIVLVVGLMSVVAAMAGAASASSWTNSGDTAFTATSGAMTYTANGVSLTCTSGTLFGTAPVTAAGPVYSVTMSGNWNGCRWAGAPVTWTCSDRWTGTSISGAVSSGTLAVNCTITGGCTVTGNIAGTTYRNSGGTLATAGRLSYPASTTLRIGGSGCLLGSGSMSLTAQIFTVTSGTGGPILSQP